MHTRELLPEHRKLEKTDPAAAQALLETNKSNELFVSLVQLRNEILPAIIKMFSAVIDEEFDRSDRSDL